MAISVARRGIQLAGHPALRHDHDAVRQREHLRQVGGHHQERHAARGEIAQDAVDVRLGADVDAARRLIDDEDARVARQPLGEQHLLLVAARQIAHLALDVRRGDAQLVDIALADLRASRPSTAGPSACRRGRLAATTLAVIVKSMNRPLSLRSSGSIEMPAAMESDGTVRPQLAAVDQHAARLDGPRAEDRLADLRAPGAEQAREADDLAVAQREGRRDDRVGDEVADLERDGCVRRRRDADRARRKARARPSAR